MSRSNRYPDQVDGVVAIGVDIQNDFLPLGRLPVPEGDQVIEPFNNVAQWVRDRSGAVIFTRDWHPPDSEHFKQWGEHCVQYKTGAAFADDLILYNPSELAGDGGDIVASKGMKIDEDAYSGLEARLNYFGWERIGLDASVQSFLKSYMDGQYYDQGRFPAHARFERLAILVGGLATDYCVKATVLDALKLYDFNKLDMFSQEAEIANVYVIKDAIKAVNIKPNDGKNAITQMKSAGARFVTSQQILNGDVIKLSKK